MIAPANVALRLSPSDPEAHFARANVLANSGELSEAVEEFEQAARLRPEDYYLWLMLGTARYQAEDEQGALLAFGEAVRLAPFYAQPHFQLGNELYVAGRQDEAFAELRRAALSDPSLLPYAIDLAWRTSAGDAQAVERIIQPQSTAERLALARFFARHGKTAEAIALFRATNNLSDEDRRGLLDELLKAGKFHEAYEVWAANHDGRSVEQSQSALTLIRNGSFEAPINLDEQGFGWQRGRNVQAVRLSLDKDERRDGSHSLRVDFTGGDYDPRHPIISQLVLVDSKSRYRLRFAARTGELVTGGLPVIAVVDAGKEGTVIAQSKPLPGGTSDWQDYSVEFTTGEGTSAVKIIFQRQNCSSDLCPVFGHAWLDSFSMQKLT